MYQLVLLQNVDPLLPVPLLKALVLGASTHPCLSWTHGQRDTRYGASNNGNGVLSTLALCRRRSNFVMRVASVNAFRYFQIHFTKTKQPKMRSKHRWQSSRRAEVHSLKTRGEPKSQTSKNKQVSSKDGVFTSVQVRTRKIVITSCSTCLVYL